jgi:hypothetical protein
MPPLFHFLKIHFNIIPHLRVISSSVFFPSGLPHKIAVCTSSVTHTCHIPFLSHSSLYVTRIKFRKAYRSGISSLCSHLHSLVTSSLLGPHIFLSTLFSNTFNLWETKIYSPTLQKKQAIIPNCTAKYYVEQTQDMPCILIYIYIYMCVCVCVCVCVCMQIS